MPLSKVRMRARKRQDRFDKQHSSPYQANPVKPNVEDIVRANPVMSRSVRARLAVQAPDVVIPELDADGNPIPTY